MVPPTGKPTARPRAKGERASAGTAFHPRLGISDIERYILTSYAHASGEPKRSTTGSLHRPPPAAATGGITGQPNEKCSKSKSDSGWPIFAAEYPVILSL